MGKEYNQLLLNLEFTDEYNLNNFFFSQKNKFIHNHLVSLNNRKYTTLNRYTYLYGVSGVGLTHLLFGMCLFFKKNKKKYIYLPMNKINEFSVEIFEGIENLDLVCIDNIENISGNEKWERALFNFFNCANEANCKILVTAKNIPKNIGINLNDLLSRLNSGLIIRINELCDEEKINAIIFKADKIGLNLERKVINYLINHYHRETKSLFIALKKLDYNSLRIKRKLTIPFIKDILRI